MWLTSRPGSRQSSWHVPSLLDVHFSFLEVDSQAPRFILLSRETGSLSRLTSPQLFLFRILKELCHWSPELILGNSVPFSFQLPCMGPIGFLSKLLEHSFPRYLHGCFFSHYPLLCWPLKGLLLIREASMCHSHITHDFHQIYENLMKTILFSSK